MPVPLRRLMAASSDIPVDNTVTTQPRLIRSFVRREGRMTRAQEQALEDLWPTYGLEFSPATLIPASVFGRPAPLTLDIGPGMGLTTVSLAAAQPQRDYLAVEVHRPGIGSLLHQIRRAGISNVRALCHDAIEVIHNMLADASLDQVLVMFPDPWPKKRHHKRRLLNAEFARLLRPRLKSHALVYVATDWLDYAEQIPAIFENNGYINLAGSGRASPRPRWRPLTKFEQRGLGLGHSVRDFIFCCSND